MRLVDLGAPRTAATAAIVLLVPLALERLKELRLRAVCIGVPVGLGYFDIVFFGGQSPWHVRVLDTKSIRPVRASRPLRHQLAKVHVAGPGRVELWGDVRSGDRWWHRPRRRARPASKV
jgi:hypothetical protein